MDAKTRDWWKICWQESGQKNKIMLPDSFHITRRCVILYFSFPDLVRDGKNLQNKNCKVGGNIEKSFLNIEYIPLRKSMRLKRI